MINRSFRRWLVVCAVACGLSVPLRAYADDALSAPVVECAIDIDSIQLQSGNMVVCPDRKFEPRDLILPGALITAGSVGIACKGINNSVRRGMDHLRGTRYLHVDDYLQYLPVVAYVGLDFAGVRSRHSIRERLAAGVTAYAVMAAIVNGVKYTIREKRPDSSARNSFPSGHTATVFTGAELVRMEYGPGIGIAAYSIATGVAFLRLYNGRHWLNDVLAGAGIGILSARIGYWMLPLYRKWFGLYGDCRSPVVAIAPAYDPGSRSVSANLAILF